MNEIEGMTSDKISLPFCLQTDDNSCISYYNHDIVTLTNVKIEMN